MRSTRGGLRLAPRAALAFFVLGAGGASLALLPSCASYRSAPLDATAALRGDGSTAPRPTAFEGAVRWAIGHNPDLRALRQRAVEAGAPPAGEPVGLSVGRDADERWEAELEFDVLSLLGLGTRAAETCLARARANEAWLEVHARAREIAGEIGESYAVLAALATAPDPGVDVDVSAFVRAGYEPASAESTAHAVTAAADSERAARAAESEAALLALARLLGLSAAERASPTLPTGEWPDALAGDVDPAALVPARPDLQRRIAAFEVADRDLRKAVAEQYPGIVLAPGLAFEPTTGFGAVRLRLPHGAGSRVRAAEAAREAARADIDSAVLDALREARESRARHRAAAAALAAARARWTSSNEFLRTAKARVSVSSGSIVDVVYATDALVSAAKGLREALVEEARARVRAARAGGWPGPSK